MMEKPKSKPRKRKSKSKTVSIQEVYEPWEKTLESHVDEDLDLPIGSPGHCFASKINKYHEDEDLDLPLPDCFASNEDHKEEKRRDLPCPFSSSGHCDEDCHCEDSQWKPRRKYKQAVTSSGQVFQIEVEDSESEIEESPVKLRGVKVMYPRYTGASIDYESLRRDEEKRKENEKFRDYKKITLEELEQRRKAESQQYEEVKRQKEEAEQAKQALKEAERAKQAKEESEQAKRALEETERAKRVQEEAERLKRYKEEAERVKERVKRTQVEAELAKRALEEDEGARQVQEEAERVKQQRENAKRQQREKADLPSSDERMKIIRSHFKIEDIEVCENIANKLAGRTIKSIKKVLELTMHIEISDKIKLKRTFWQKVFRKRKYCKLDSQTVLLMKVEKALQKMG